MGTIFAIIEKMKELLKTLAKQDYIIADYEAKLQLLALRNDNPWLRFKIYSVDEVMAMFLGRVNVQTLLELMTRYDIDFEHARIINENLVFPHDSNLNAKTIQLSNYRRDLIRDGLIDIDPFVKYAFSGKKVLLSAYLLSHTPLISLLKEAGAIIDYFSNTTTYDTTVNIYKTSMEEVYGALNTIASLLSKGVSPRDIKVLRPSTDYLNLLYRLAPQFNIVFSEKSESLLSFPTIQSLINELEDGTLKFEDVNTLELEENTVNNAFLNTFSNISFNNIPESIRVAFLRYKLAGTRISLFDNDGIEIIDELPSFVYSDKHYFFLNFAQGVAPTLVRGSRLLTNAEIASFGSLTHEQESLLNEEKLMQSLRSIRHKHISFAKIFSSVVFNTSPLVKKFNMREKNAVLSEQFFSQEFLNYTLALKLDDFNNYHIIDETLPLLYASNAESDQYSSFDYRFKGIDYDVKKPLKLSYSSIDLYNKLPFDYFAKYHLGIVDRDGNFNINYGNFVHKLFEMSNNPTTFEYSFYYYIDKYDFSPKEKFFIENTKPIIDYAFAFYLDYVEVSRPTKVFKEKEVSIKLNDDAYLNGKLDRVLLYEQGSDPIAVVIDYKTGSGEYKSNFFSKGLYLQLPLYGLLLSEDKEYSDAKIGALVINSFKTDKYVLQNEEQLKFSLNRSLKFKGLVVDDTETLEVIDPTYIYSKYYRSLRLTKNSGKIAATIEAEEFENIITLAKEQALLCAQRIINNEFPVRTIQIDSSSNSGRHSAYKRISYIPSADYFKGASDDD